MERSVRRYEVGSKDNFTSLETYAGQICHMRAGGRPVLHNAGLPINREHFDGWGNSEIIMFPLVGPAGSSWKKTPNIRLDQHGLSRNLEWRTIDRNETGATLLQTYRAGEKIKNPKFNENKPHLEYLFWPFNFELKKSFKLSPNKLEIGFEVTNNSDESMPYQFGWHPAFRMIEDGEFDLLNQNLDFESLKKYCSTNTVLSLPNQEQISYSNGEEGILVESKGFGNMMLWAPENSKGMFCIEPVTRIPDLSNNYESVADQKYPRLLLANESQKYSVTIEVM